MERVYKAVLKAISSRVLMPRTLLPLFHWPTVASNRRPFSSLNVGHPPTYLDRYNKVNDSYDQRGKGGSPCCDCHSRHNELCHPNHDRARDETNYSSPPPGKLCADDRLNYASKHRDDDSCENLRPEVCDAEAWHKESDEHQHQCRDNATDNGSNPDLRVSFLGIFVGSKTTPCPIKRSHKTVNPQCITEIAPFHILRPLTWYCCTTTFSRVPNFRKMIGSFFRNPAYNGPRALLTRLREGDGARHQTPPG